MNRKQREKERELGEREASLNLEGTKVWDDPVGAWRRARLLGSIPRNWQGLSWYYTASWYYAAGTAASLVQAKDVEGG